MGMWHVVAASFVCEWCLTYVDVVGVYMFDMHVSEHAVLVCMHACPMYTHMSCSVFNILSCLSLKKILLYYIRMFVMEGENNYNWKIRVLEIKMKWE